MQIKPEGFMGRRNTAPRNSDNKDLCAIRKAEETAPSAQVFPFARQFFKMAYVFMSVSQITSEVIFILRFVESICLFCCIQPRGVCA